MQQEPHDLNDEEMCLDETGIQTAMKSLENGWNTSRRVIRAAWRKARFRRGEVAEDVLEIVIGTHCRDLERRVEYVVTTHGMRAVADHCRQVRQRRQETQDSMPEFARMDAELVISRIQDDPDYRIPGRDFGWTPLDVQCLMGYHCCELPCPTCLGRASTRGPRS